MPKENDSSGSVDETQTTTVETTATDVPSSTQEAEKTEEPKGLSRRDALEVAIEAAKASDNAERKTTEEVKPETRAQVFKAPKPEDKSGGRVAKQSSDRTNVPKLNAPGEWTREEKEDFGSLSEKQQAAHLRLYNARKGTLEQITRAANEHTSLKQLAESMGPYLKAVGVREPTEVALKKALSMWQEFETGDPRKAAAAYLKAKGMTVPKELLEGTSSNVSDEKITPLQARLDALEQTIANERMSKTRSVLGNAWAVFESEKNAAGGLKYPDASGTETARNIGSLVRGDTELSKHFIARVRQRIPDATMSTLIREAYRIEGYQIDDSEAPRTQTTQSHIKQASRAAASVPPSGGRSATTAPVKRFADRKEALAAAIADLNNRE